MDINDIKYENWKIVKKLGTGSFGSVYEIERNDFGVYKAALKVISIPQYSEEIQEIRNSGMSEQSVADYYSGMVEDIISEFALMNKLKGTTNIVSYEDHQIIPHEGEIGWDIYIRMELLTPLDKYMEEHPFEEADVARLGVDICRALERCEKLNIIHRDIKPGNIFVSDQGDFKLGDFGIARTVERTGSNMSRKGTYNYMAPEVYNGMDYGQTVDLYSLGLVMYRLLNHGRTPFLPLFPEQIKFQDQEIALLKRINGTPLPYPNNEPSTLGDIILKACAYDPANRFQDALEFRRALELWLGLTEVGEDGTVGASGTIGAGSIGGTIGTGGSGTGGSGSGGSGQKKKLGIIIGIAAAVVVIAVLLIVLLRKPPETPPGGSGASIPETKEEGSSIVLLDYTGHKAADVKDDLEKAGLSVVTEEADGAEKAGTILKQEPAEGSELKKGDQVTFTVSKGNLIAIPAFYNHSLKGFTESLGENAEDVEIVVSDKVKYDKKVEPGRIISIAASQNGSSNTKLKKGDLVPKGSRLVVTLCGVQIPKNIVGMSGKDAQEALSGLKINSVSSYSDAIGFGCVIRITDAGGSEIAPGTVLKKGTPVNVYISAGPQPQEQPTYDPGPYYPVPEPEPTLPAPPDVG